MSDYKTVAAYFPSQASAESVITALKAAGFQQSQIGVAAASSSSASSVTGETTDSAAYNTGHNVGGAWDKVKSFFSGSSAEPYAGETTTDTFNDNVISPETYGSDDVHGSLTGLSVPDEHTRYFGQRLGSGSGAVVTVSAPGREDEALDILIANGGEVGAGAAEYENTATDLKTAGAQNIHLYGEVLRVHKDRVASGEVRIRKEVITTTQTVEVPVTREELVVERVPVSGTETATGTAFSGEEIRIPLSEERASVSKEAVVREQVRVGKKEVTNVESFDEQVRSEELKVDQTAKADTVKSA